MNRDPTEPDLLVQGRMSACVLRLWCGFIALLLNVADIFAFTESTELSSVSHKWTDVFVARALLWAGGGGGATRFRLSSDPLRRGQHLQPKRRRNNLYCPRPPDRRESPLSFPLPPAWAALCPTPPAWASLPHTPSLAPSLPHAPCLGLFAPHPQPGRPHPARFSPCR